MRLHPLGEEVTNKVLDDGEVIQRLRTSPI